MNVEENTNTELDNNASPQTKILISKDHYGSSFLCVACMQRLCVVPSCMDHLRSPTLSTFIPLREQRPHIVAVNGNSLTVLINWW